VIIDPKCVIIIGSILPAAVAGGLDHARLIPKMRKKNGLTPKYEAKG
jgi:hypothetical protein